MNALTTATREYRFRNKVIPFFKGLTHGEPLVEVARTGLNYRLDGGQKRAYELRIAGMTNLVEKMERKPSFDAIADVRDAYVITRRNSTKVAAILGAVDMAATFVIGMAAAVMDNLSLAIATAVIGSGIQGLISFGYEETMRTIGKAYGKTRACVTELINRKMAEPA